MERMGIKIGRNELCPCGSNLKYKKCCLNVIEVKKGYSDDVKIKRVEAVQKEKIKKLFGNKVLFAAPDSKEIKMSEIILEFAKEYLDTIETDERRKSMISLVCMAWNLSLLKGESTRRLEINKIVSELKLDKDHETCSELKEVLEKLIKKKLKRYGSINRFIIDYQITDMGSSFHLNIMSTISNQELVGDTNTKRLSLTILEKLKQLLRFIRLRIIR